MLTIRQATVNDMGIVADIYNDAILNTTATFDTEIKTLENRIQWLNQHSAMNPVIVGELDGIVVGWASLSKWSDRCAYDTTAEVSVYVHKDFRDRGIGRKLLEVITLEGEKAGLHTILSRITQGNEKSIHLHEIFGYEHVGVLREVGMKFGQFLDVHMMQKVFAK
ncbi:MAG TPA: N-acetyltransferase family protein [Bacteroidia bacterium]|jgi:phosphinothricin acetyltransferase|nr:N-acetyltransferase family protein [Bacteroidia bacterium]HQF27277.1 N-acetyltransferase family protein [Bacteroidia bacterium]HQK97576.1 N-acetyltransferase family protein [Bacteroidia bacterium]